MSTSRARGPRDAQAARSASPAWQRYPYHRPSTALFFPRDEGWHSLLPNGLSNPSLSYMEWTYVNAHLEEEGGRGRRFAVFAAYFTQGLRFLVVRAWDADDRYLGSWTGTSMGLLRPSRDRHDLEYRHPGGLDRWRTLSRADGSLDPFHTRLEATGSRSEFSMDLELACTKQPYEAGGLGWLPFGRAGSFGYYSLTRLDIGGSLELPTSAGREAIRVRGLGWFDHQWGPFYVTPFRVPGAKEYEWMAIQLDSGDDFMLTTVWDETGATPERDAYGGVGWIRDDGTHGRLVSQRAWRRTRFWRSPTQGAVYSAGWTLDVDDWETHLVITPRHPDQLAPMIEPRATGLLPDLSARLLRGPIGYLGDFWEGACDVTGTLRGEPVRGWAFAELIKRYRDPELDVEIPHQAEGVAVVAWHVRHADPQVPLLSRVLVEDQRGRLLARLDELDVAILVLDDPALPRGEPLVVRITTSSVDGTLSGTAKIEVKLR